MFRKIVLWITIISFALFIGIFLLDWITPDEVSLDNLEGRWVSERVEDNSKLLVEFFPNDYVYLDRIGEVGKGFYEYYPFERYGGRLIVFAGRSVNTWLVIIEDQSILISIGRGNDFHRFKRLPDFNWQFVGISLAGIICLGLMIGEKNFEWLNKIFRKQKFIIDGILAILILLSITDFLFGIFSGNDFGLLRWITGLKPPWNSIMMAESILLLRIVLLKRRILITSRWVSRFYALTVFLISFGLLLLPVAGLAFWIIDLPYLGNETWGIIENLWILIK